MILAQILIILKRSFSQRMDSLSTKKEEEEIRELKLNVMSQSQTKRKLHCGDLLCKKSITWDIMGCKSQWKVTFKF